MGELTVGGIQDDFNDYGGQSATKKGIVNGRAYSAKWSERRWRREVGGGRGRGGEGRTVSGRIESYRK
jgi:hypothetical protein